METDFLRFKSSPQQINHFWLTVALLLIQTKHSHEENVTWSLHKLETIVSLYSTYKIINIILAFQVFSKTKI